jgi:hypothetical protein
MLRRSSALLSFTCVLGLSPACSSEGTTPSGDGDGESNGDGDLPGTGGMDSATGGAAATGGQAMGMTGGTGSATGGDSGTGGTGEPSYLPDFCAGLATAPSGDQWQTEHVYYENNVLTYASDEEGNRVPDFSYAGYHYGERPLPNVAVVETIGPVDGDDTATIQAAIDQVGALALDENGHRGAVLLEPGSYQIGGQILVNASGVVLRGSGDDGDPAQDTILQITGTSTRTGVVLGSGDSSPWEEGTGVEVSSSFVPVGSLSFDVESTTEFAVGDEVVIRHHSDQGWIDAIDGGGTASGPAWPAGSKDLTWFRKIVAISGSTITLDAPIYSHLDSSLSHTTVHPMTNKGYRTEVGLEDLRVDIQTQGGEDEAHAADAITVTGAQDSWVRNVTALHFTHAGVATHGSVRITVADSVAIDPVGIRTGARFYNFDAEGNSNLILFTGCLAQDGRHNMIVNGTGSASGIVFHNIDSRGDSSASEGHRYFSHGMLFDTIYGTTEGFVQLINRGDYGTSHGWASAHSVIWGNTGRSRIQKPPTAQNYAFSSVGSLSESYPFPAEGGTGVNDVRDQGELFPLSLYEAQLCERLGKL